MGTTVVRSEAAAERHLSEFSTQGGWRGMMVVAGAELAEPHFPNSQLRAVGGVSGGHGARLAERLSELSNTGGWWG